MFGGIVATVVLVAAVVGAIVYMRVLDAPPSDSDDHSSPPT